MRSVALVVVFGIYGMNAGAVDLDAPVSKTPTVRSELKRGNDAEFECLLHHVPTRIDWRSYVTCIDEAIHNATQERRLSDPFLAGMYFAIVSHLDIHGPGSPAGNDPRFDQHLSLYRAELRKLLRELHLAPLQVCQALEYIKCDHSVEAATHP